MAKSIEQDLVEKFKKIMQRYGGSTPEAFVEVLCPILVPIKSLDKTIFKEWTRAFPSII